MRKQLTMYIFGTAIAVRWESREKHFVTPPPILSVHFRIVTLNAWLKPVDDLVSPQFLMMVQWKLKPVIKSIAMQSTIQVCKSTYFRYLHIHAYSCTIHDSRGIELALVSICRWMVKQMWCVCMTEFYSAIKNRIMSFAQKLIELKFIVLG